MKRAIDHLWRGVLRRAAGTSPSPRGSPRRPASPHRQQYDRDALAATLQHRLDNTSSWQPCLHSGLVRGDGMGAARSDLGSASLARHTIRELRSRLLEADQQLERGQSSLIVGLDRFRAQFLAARAGSTSALFGECNSTLCGWVLVSMVQNRLAEAPTVRQPVLTVVARLGFAARGLLYCWSARLLSPRLSGSGSSRMASWTY
jgi:hypothetical protein